MASESPQKRTNQKPQEDNNNTNKFLERQQARAFIVWFKRMIDHERENLTLYLSDEAILEWFGRTIKTRKKVSSFLKHDMQYSRHDFSVVESINKVHTQQERLALKRQNTAKSLHSPELIQVKPERVAKKRALRSTCSSPEWAEGCQPEEEIQSTGRKLFKTQNGTNDNFKDQLKPFDLEIHNKGDCGRRNSRKFVQITPPNEEIGQGDCLPSTSGTDSNKSHDALNSQLPKLAVECKGYIEFTRTRHNRSMDAMKWERKCKLQISYSEDPLNVGEYIIWSLHYSDESKCRRNLLAAFEEVAREQS